MTSPTVPAQLRSGLRAVYGVVLALLPTRFGDRLRDLVARTRARWPQLDGPSGGRVRVPGPLDHPVVLVVAVGCAPTRLRQAVDGMSGVPVRPVWLVDTPLPGDLADQVIEWLPPAADLMTAGSSLQLETTGGRSGARGLRNLKTLEGCADYQMFWD